VMVKIGGNDSLTQAQEYLRTGLSIAEQYPGPDRQSLVDSLNLALQKLTSQPFSNRP
jgi:ABC-type sugar transport system substrate-binding protein